MKTEPKSEPKEKDKFFPEANNTRWTADSLLTGITILPKKYIIVKPGEVKK